MSTSSFDKRFEVKTKADAEIVLRCIMQTTPTYVPHDLERVSEEALKENAERLCKLLNSRFARKDLHG